MRMKLWHLLVLGFAALLANTSAEAQITALSNVVGTCGTPNGAAYSANQNRPQTVDETGKECVNATVNATVSGYTPGSTQATQQSVTTSTGNVALPVGSAALIQNSGTTNGLYFQLGTSNAVTATANDIYLGPGSSCVAVVGSNTYVAFLGTGATTANVTGGAGLGSCPTGGGGGSGGGSSGTVAQGSSTSGQSGNLIQGAVTTSAPTYTTAQTNPLSLTTGGLLRETDAAAETSLATIATNTTNAGTPAVTGTVTANAGTNLNTSALATSANQVTNAAQNSTTSGQTGPLIQGAVTTSAPSYTSTHTSPLSLDTAGNLRVNVVTGGAGGGAVYGPTAVGSAAANPPVLAGGTADGTATGNVGVAKIVSGVLSANTAQVNGVTTLAGTGAVGTGAQRVAVGTDTATIAGSAPGTAGTPSANVVSIQGVSSGTTVPVTSAQGTFANLKGQSEITDGTNIAAVKAASTAPLATDPSIVVAISPNSVNANGSATSANSAPVVIASDQAPFGYTAGATTSGEKASLSAAATTSGAVLNTTAQTNFLVASLNGGLITTPYTNPENLVSGLTTAMTGTTSTAVTGMGAPGSGLHNYITALVCGNSHATVGTFVILQDGSAGTTFFEVPAAAIYGGASLPFPAPLRQPTANTALYVADVTTGANVICSVSGFKGP